MNYSQERNVVVQVDSRLAVGHIDDGHRLLASVACGGACGRARGEVGRRERRGHGGRSRQRHAQSSLLLHWQSRHSSLLLHCDRATYTQSVNRCLKLPKLRELCNLAGCLAS